MMWAGEPSRRVAYRWQAIVRQEARRRSLRVKLAQWLRRLVVWIDP